MWWFILLAIAFLVIALRLRSTNHGMAVLMAVLAMLAAIPALALRIWPVDTLPDDFDYSTAAGFALGQKVSSDFPEGGRLLMLYYPPLEKASADSTATCYDGFRKGLGAVLERFDINEAGPNRMNLGTNRDGFTLLSEEDVFGDAITWCEDHPDTVAVVSLLPSLPNLRSPTLRGETPWYGFYQMQTEHDLPVFDDPRLRAAIVPNFHRQAENAPPRGAPLEELFAFSYRLLTPDSATAP
jgi:hypothetical protein